MPHYNVSPLPLNSSSPLLSSDIIASPRRASPRLASPRLCLRRRRRLRLRLTRRLRLASPHHASPRLASPRLASPRFVVLSCFLLCSSLFSSHSLLPTLSLRSPLLSPHRLFSPLLCSPPQLLSHSPLSACRPAAPCAFLPSWLHLFPSSPQRLRLLGLHPVLGLPWPVSLSPHPPSRLSSPHCSGLTAVPLLLLRSLPRSAPPRPAPRYPCPVDHQDRPAFLFTPSLPVCI
jgi:hypothetical protein